MLEDFIHLLTSSVFSVALWFNNLRVGAEGDGRGDAELVQEAGKESGVAFFDAGIDENRDEEHLFIFDPFLEGRLFFEKLDRLLDGVIFKEEGH